MPTLQELREAAEKKKNALQEFSKKIEERKTAGKTGLELLNAEESKNWDQWKKDYSDLKSQIETEERAQHVLDYVSEIRSAEEKQRGPGGRDNPTLDDPIPGERAQYGDRFENRDHARSYATGERRRALLVAAWVSAIHGLPVTDEQRQACHELKFSPAASEISFKPFDTQEFRALQRSAGSYAGEARQLAVQRHMERRAVITKAADGATLVPQVMINAYEEAMITFGGVLAAADVWVSANGGREMWPTGNDTNNEGVQLADETTPDDMASVDPDFAPMYLDSYEFSSKFIRVGNPTLRDSPLDLAGILGSMIGERLNRIINRRATVGNGSNTLLGIAHAPAIGRTMGANAYTHDELVRLKHSVDSAYREQGLFMLSDDILLNYLLLKDEQGRPLLWEPNGDSPGRLLNRPYIINNFMATTASITSAGGHAVLFGDLKAYKMRLVGQVDIKRAVERFIEFNQTGFIGLRGADGKPLPFTGAAARIKSLHRTPPT
jgi:HK97 family phage major capsid protein